MTAKGSGPYSGFDSLPDAIAALRRGRVRVLGVHQLSGRSVVLEAQLIEGDVGAGMILMPMHRRHDNIYVELAIKSVEFIRQPGGVENLGLMLGTTPATVDANLAHGSIVEVLERSPAA